MNVQDSDLLRHLSRSVRASPLQPLQSPLRSAVEAGVNKAPQAIPPQVLATVAVALLLRIAVACASNYTAEDFMITLRYAENFAAGHGLVYNLGERVLGTTTPLYTLFLALAAWLHLSPTLCGKAINILADGGLCLVLYLWLRHEGLEKAGRIAAFLAAVHPIQIRWAISGMETSLVAAAGVWAMYALSRRRYIEVYCALGTLFLLRWDSVLLAVIVTAAICFRERRAPFTGLSLFALIVLPWIIVAGRYYGNPIPITGQAKVHVYGWFADHLGAKELRVEATGFGQGLTSLIRYEPTWLLRRVPRQQKLLNYVIGSVPAFLLALAAVIGFIHAIRARRWQLMPPALWILVYFAAFLLSRVLVFEWYLVPPLPVFEVFAAIGLALWADRASAVLPARTRLPAAVATLSFAAIVPTAALVPILRRSQQVEETVRKPIGLWLYTNSLPGDRILLEPIGYIGYYSRRSVIDVIGLVSPQVLPYYSAAEVSPWLSQIRDFQPEWCVLRAAETADIERTAAARGFDWHGQYKLAHTGAFRSQDSLTPLIFYVYHRVPPTDLEAQSRGNP